MTATLLRRCVWKLVVANLPKVKMLPPKVKMLPPKTLFPQQMTVRGTGHLIPPSQYDGPRSKKMRFPKVLIKNWEVIPLFGCTVGAMGIMCYAIIWALANKVDVVFRTHSRRNISRTMNLLKPTAHKMVLIEQTYTPWPKMYEVLVKMRKQENNLKEKSKVLTVESTVN